MLSAIYSYKFFLLGEKSDDPLSPAYVPSIFSFTTNDKKRKAEQDMDRYGAVKHRRENKDSAETSQNSNSAEANDCSGKEKAIVYPSNIICTHAQTDLTVNSLTTLEDDYRQRMI